MSDLALTTSRRVVARRPGLLARLFGADARYRDARHLDAMSDELLADIGLTRDEATRLAWGDLPTSGSFR